MELTERYALPPAAAVQLDRLLDALVLDSHAPTAIRSRESAINDHLADALVALEIADLRSATTLADVGSGAGVPGLPLAIALPDTRFTLIDSSARKCAFIERTASACELPNVTVIHVRAEEMGGWRASFDVVTARALASPAVVAEYGAPLLRLGGTLIAWRGKRDDDAELQGERAARELGLSAPSVLQVRPYPGAEHRYLHLMSKVSETPVTFPRRPGMALKRPLGTV